MTNIKRISLLSETEINDLYARPDFSHHERTLYFAMNEREYGVLNNYSNVRTRAYFILQLGYFKAKQQFFKFNFDDVRNDVEYILTNFFSRNTTVLSGCISRNYIESKNEDILFLSFFISRICFFVLSRNSSLSIAIDPANFFVFKNRQHFSVGFNSGEYAGKISICINFLS